MKKIKVFTTLIVMNNDCDCDTMDEKSFCTYEDAHSCFLEYKNQMLNDAIDCHEKGIIILTNNEDEFAICDASDNSNIEVAKIVVTDLEIPE